MSLYLGDIRIKTAIELGLEDIKKNPWLLNDILGDTVANQYLRERYSSQISSCTQWLENNRINVVFSMREDRLEFPAISIELGSSNEKTEMKHMGDLSYEKVHLYPNEINRPVPYIVPPSSGSYDPTLGLFTFSGTVSLLAVSPGQALVDPSTGTAYIAQSVPSANQVQLLTGLSLNATLYGVIPEYRYFETRVGHTFMQEEYNIVCHGLDQQTLLWLHSIVVYSLLRYRQTLLEADGGAESIIKSTKMYPNADYSDAGQVIWSRSINLSIQVENRFLEQPHRIIENVAFQGPLKIISNITDTAEDLDTVNWATLAAIAEQGDS